MVSPEKPIFTIERGSRKSSSVTSESISCTEKSEKSTLESSLSPKAPKRTIILLALFACFATFNAGVGFYALNTAMDSYKQFINESLTVMFSEVFFTTFFNIFLIEKINNYIFMIFIDFLQSHYSLTPTKTQLDWVLVAKMAVGSFGSGTGYYLMSIIAERFGRRGRCEHLYVSHSGNNMC